MTATTPTSSTPIQSLQHPPSAVVALIMGILGLSALPVIGAILALAFGSQSRRAAATQPEVYTDDLGRIGRILGWVGIGLVALGLLFVLGAVVVLM